MAGSAASNQVALLARKMEASERLNRFYDQIENLRGICLLCFGHNKHRHNENNECVRKANACFKCLRAGCGSGSCPTLSSFGDRNSITNMQARPGQSSKQRGTRSLAGFRSALPLSTNAEEEMLEKVSPKTHSWYFHMPLKYNGMRTHKPGDFGWIACLIRKVVQLSLIP